MAFMIANVHAGCTFTFPSFSLPGAHPGKADDELIHGRVALDQTIEVVAGRRNTGPAFMIEKRWHDLNYHLDIFRASPKNAMLHITIGYS